VPGQSEQGVDVEVFLHESPQQVEASFARRGETDARPGQTCDLCEECCPELVTFEAAVPHRAEDLTLASAAEELLDTRLPRHPPVVDLISMGGRAQGGAVREAERLLRREPR